MAADGRSSPSSGGRKKALEPALLQMERQLGKAGRAPRGGDACAGGKMIRTQFDGAGRGAGPRRPASGAAS